MESRDIATNQIQIQKDRKNNVYHEVVVSKVSNQNVSIELSSYLEPSLILFVVSMRAIQKS